VAVATTIVSSRLLGEIARAHGALYFETLTGFKWIANGALRLAEIQDDVRFAFGYEEALGYTVGELVRDKDGISAAIAFAEMALVCKARGINAVQRLEEIYREHGLYLTGQRTLALKPGAPSMGDKLRSAPPRTIAGRAVEAIADLTMGKRSFRDGRSEPLDLPKSDVLIYALEGDARAIVRPSGTEPKLKCYYEVHERVGPDEAFAEAEARARASLEDLMTRHQGELG
jgi:phosphomannomutase